MSNTSGGRPQLGPKDALALLAALLGPAVAFLLPIAFPQLGEVTARWLIYAIGIGASILLVVLIPALRARLVRQLVNLLELPTWIGHHRVISIIVGALLVFAGIGAVANSMWQPLVVLQKAQVHCLESRLVIPLCADHDSSFSAITLRISTRNPLVAFPNATLTDRLSEFVGPTTLNDPAQVDGPGGFTMDHTEVNVPKDKWLKYVRGSTVQLFDRSTPILQIPDSPGGQGHLFVGYSLGNVSDGPLSSNPWKTFEFAYLVHFVDAVPAQTGMQLTMNVKNLSRGGMYGPAASAAAGETVRIEYELANLTDYTLDASVTGKMPPAALLRPTIAETLSSALGGVSASITIQTEKKLYVNYVPESTMQLTANGSPILVPDVDQVGPIFTSTGSTVAIAPGTDTPARYYFDAILDTKPGVFPQASVSLVNQNEPLRMSALDPGRIRRQEPKISRASRAATVNVLEGAGALMSAAVSLPKTPATTRLPSGPNIMSLRSSSDLPFA